MEGFISGSGRWGGGGGVGAYNPTNKVHSIIADKRKLKYFLNLLAF